MAEDEKTPDAEPEPSEGSESGKKPSRLWHHLWILSMISFLFAFLFAFLSMLLYWALLLFSVACLVASGIAAFVEDKFGEYLRLASIPFLVTGVFFAIGTYVMSQEVDLLAEDQAVWIISARLSPLALGLVMLCIGIYLVRNPGKPALKFAGAGAIFLCAVITGFLLFYLATSAPTSYPSST